MLNIGRFQTIEGAVFLGLAEGADLCTVNSNSCSFSFFLLATIFLYFCPFLAMKGKLIYFWLLGFSVNVNVLGKLFGICSSLSRRSFTYFAYVQGVILIFHFCPGAQYDCLGDHLDDFYLPSDSF